jgi:hypothetical protein
VQKIATEIFMKNTAFKKPALLLFSASLLIATIIIVITACKQPLGSDAGKGNGETRLVVGMYDAFQSAAVSARSAEIPNNGRNIQGIEALNLTVCEMVVIDSNDNHITILNEERTMDILGVSKSEPVILSNVSIEPGVYKELRLVLEDENSITINGETHPIRIPSGEQSGLKLKGPFEIPKGKLFTLMIELDTDRSVHWNQGQGYTLRPVLNIGNGVNVVGIFRGNMTVSGNIGAGETLVQLNDDGTAQMRISSYPRYTVRGQYYYNSMTKILRLNDFDLSGPKLSRLRKRKIMNKFPNEVNLPVKQWSPNDIIAIDTAGVKVNLQRVDEFNFNVNFTEFTLNVDYPDSSASGKEVAAVIEFIDSGMTTQTITGTIEGSRFTENVMIPNNYFIGSNTQLRITAYLFDDPEDLNTEVGVYASNLTEIMSGSRFSETTVNPWQEEQIYTLERDETGQELTVEFPRRLNIRMEHENFTTNNPVISWDSHPDARNGYFAMVLTENKDRQSDSDSEAESSFFNLAWYERTDESEFQFPLQFGESYEIDSNLNTVVRESDIVPGDIIRIEVYVLDDSGTLDLENRTGALCMNSLNVKR